MALPVYLFIFVQLLFVSWGDIKSQKIPNYWAILNIICFITLLLLFPDTYYLNWATFIYSFSFLIIGFFLFLLKIMGGGDSKYLFSFFLIIPPTLLDMTLTSLLISTVLIGLFVFFTNFVRNFEKIYNHLKIMDVYGLKYCFGSKFSFAPVILMAWMLVGWNIRKTLF
jgi:prepilin peptidase CpaA